LRSEDEAEDEAGEEEGRGEIREWKIGDEELPSSILSGDGCDALVYKRT
jgi:hypothetical protein